MSGTTPRVLLGDTDHYGTLAAVRDLGRVGMQVAVLDSDAALSRAATSTYCHERIVAPADWHSVTRLEGLLADGARHPGTLLYPTSDDAAWMMALRHDQLRRHFALYQPPASAVQALLDKSQLYVHADARGVPHPDTWRPTCQGTLDDIAATLERDGRYPVIVKPRTQAGLAMKVKGIVAHDTAALQAAVTRMRQPGWYADDFLRDAPADIQWPLVQQYMPEAQQFTYSIAGFIDRSGTLCAARASVKVFQIPVRVGVGVAFEGRTLLPRLVEKIEAIARATGYFGVCEVEFIHVARDDRYYLMDFNPRYYGQMNFEVSRGLALPRMVLAAATGDDASFAALAAESARLLRGADADQQRYCNRWLFQSLLRAQRVAGRLAPQTHARWKAWMAGAEVFDFVSATDDPAPAEADRKRYLRQWVRYPRSSYRELFR